MQPNPQANGPIVHHVVTNIYNDLRPPKSPAKKYGCCAQFGIFLGVLFLLSFVGSMAASSAALAIVFGVMGCLALVFAGVYYYLYYIKKRDEGTGEGQGHPPAAADQEAGRKSVRWANDQGNSPGYYTRLDEYDKSEGAANSIHSRTQIAMFREAFAASMPVRQV